jgi:general secretion pathway protein D
MRVLNNLPTFKRIRYSLLSACILALMTSCALAPWEENKLKKKAPEQRAAISEDNLKQSPESIKLRKDLYMNKESAIFELMAQAEQARLNGDLEAALRFYERILSFAAHDQSALAGKEEVMKELAQNKTLENASALLQSNDIAAAKSKVHEVLLENPRKKSALMLDNQLRSQASSSATEPPKLKPTTDKPVTIELRDANIKAVFEALSRATGINFILDKDIKPETKASIFVKKLPIEDAIDMILSSNGLQKKVLSENTALIFPSNVQKLKDYQDLKIRSFYLNNTNAKQVAGMLKSMLKTKDIYIDERINMLVMRDTPEVVRIAEKLVSSVDIADAEVMLDIEVLEVSRSRIQELGIVYPNQLAVIGADTGLTLEALKQLKSSGVGVSPNPALNFKKTVGDVNLLSNPRIRVKNNEKAKVLVGDKVPIITTTSTANVGISENVTYIDVGLKLDVEPHVMLDDFVNIKVGLEVSSLGERTVTRNGATVFTIGTRNANTVLRLRDGETQILAGLILDDERKNASRLPGLGDIPLLGRLFSNQEDRKSKTEIVLAITPRIITNLALPDAEVSEYWSGTETLITDKPLTTVPAGASGPSAPLTTLERLREQRLERQRELNGTPAQDEVAPNAADEQAGELITSPAGAEGNGQVPSVAPPPVVVDPQPIPVPNTPPVNIN